MNTHGSHLKWKCTPLIIGAIPISTAVGKFAVRQFLSAKFLSINFLPHTHSEPSWNMGWSRSRSMESGELKPTPSRYRHTGAGTWGWRAVLQWAWVCSYFTVCSRHFLTMLTRLVKTMKDSPQSVSYNNTAFIVSLIISTKLLKSPPREFAPILRAHFEKNCLETLMILDFLMAGPKVTIFVGLRMLSHVWHHVT